MHRREAENPDPIPASTPIPEPSGPLALARTLVLKHGWNATAYQILNPGLKLWFPRARDAVIGYADWGRVRVAAGAPVCSPERLAEVAEEFERNAMEAHGACVCYFAAGVRLDGLLGSVPGYSRVLLGAQPVWHPETWPGILSKRPSLRAQLQRARNKSVRVREWPNAAAAASPAIRRCLKEWLSGRPMPSMHFLVEPQTLDRLWDRRIFVAQREGAPVGFLVASPVPGRNGWLVEQIVRGKDAPNGTAELLVDAAFHAAIAERLEYFTLGLSPLSRVVNDADGNADMDRSLSWWLGVLFHWLRMHGSRFYNFRGLERFKSKFEPGSWEPVYAICNQPSFAPRVLLAVAAAFGGISPFLFVAMTLGKALRQESVWIALRVMGRGKRNH